MGEGTVLLRRSSLGDVLLLGAVTGQVAPPVTVVTAPEWAELASLLPGVSQVVPWPREQAVAELAASLPPGQLVDLHGSLRSVRLCLAAGRPVRRIDKRSWRRRARVWFGSGGALPTVVERYAEACGVSPGAPPWIQRPDADADALVLCPGARWTSKRWEGFAALARHFDGPVIVLGGPGEEELCEAVASGLPEVTVYAGRGFARTLALLRRARVAVANDSGLMHLAAACGVPVVALFCSTHPDDGFFSHPGTVVQQDLDCRPCTLHGREDCPRGTWACRQQEPDAVWQAVLDQLGGQA